jgi:tetratricopeptide (TPR) repeat protein
VVFGLLFAAGGSSLAGMMGDLLDEFPADFTTRGFFRSLLCVSMALPWAVAARVGQSSKTGSGVVLLVVGLAIAFVLPGVWADKLSKEMIDLTVDELEARRITRASRLVSGVCDLDPFRTGRFNGPRHLVEFRRELALRETRLAEHLASLTPETMSSNNRLQYANDLISLDRLNEAEAALRELVRTVPPANLLLARVLHLQGRYAESDSALKELLAAGLPFVRTKPSIRKACLDAYDLLVENATRRGRSADREAVLKEGLDTLPDEEAYLRFQLGRHYKLTGRPGEAMAQLTEAVRLNRAYEPSAEALIRELRELTPACVIGR